MKINTRTVTHRQIRSQRPIGAEIKTCHRLHVLYGHRKQTVDNLMYQQPAATAIG